MKKIFARVIAIAPLNIVRLLLYRWLLGHRIAYSAKLGFGTILACRSAVIEPEVRIGPFNRFTGAFDLVIGRGTHIEKFNEFSAVTNPGTAKCTIGRQVHITSNHFFDASGGIIIGSQTRIAGRGSQFWTHGGQKPESVVAIGERCYIGAATRFAQGVSIAANTFVGLGSVVVQSCEEEGVLLFGNPAEIVKRGITARLSLVSQSGIQDES